MKRIMLFEEFVFNTQCMKELYKECSHNSFLCDKILLEKVFDVELSNKVKKLIGIDDSWEINNYASFLKSAYKSERTEFLTKYNEKELKELGIKTFKLKGYDIGFALKQTKMGTRMRCEIVSLHNNEQNIGGVGDAIISYAIKNGGNTVDHYDGFLSEFYERNGFTVIYLKTMFDEQYAEPNWNYGLYGRPDVLIRFLAE
ncbi:MAG: hypothetical protein IKO56_00400 [Alphaproteobacteria bacterium]|nr:hypothetical protein [Alphaproteobacteria bacterium]